MPKTSSSHPAIYLLMFLLFWPFHAYQADCHARQRSHLNELPDGKQPLFVVAGPKEPGGIGFPGKEKSEIECALNILYDMDIYQDIKKRLIIPLICIVNARDSQTSSNRARVTNVGYIFMPASSTSSVATVMSSLVAEIENLLNSPAYEALNDKAKADSITREEFVNGYFHTLARSVYQTLEFQKKFPAYDDGRYTNSQLKILYRDFKAGKLFDPQKPGNKLTAAQFMNIIIAPFLEAGSPGKKQLY